MLTFREINYSKDIKEIVDLIRRNLDPHFTYEHYVWKHLENPFGKSYGLLAIDEEKIVGIRMFMYWEFITQERTIVRAIRPVDTVVDIEYRGRGLFKRLTMEGLENCKGTYDFIFNTPNANSLPGYVKMGWREMTDGNFFNIGFVNPLCGSSSFVDVEVDQIRLREQSAGSFTKLTRTRNTAEYYKWRYKDQGNYQIAFFKQEEIYVIYGKTKIYTIIFEVVGPGAINNKALNTLIQRTRKPLVYFYNNENLRKVKFLWTFRRERPKIVLKDYDLNTFIKIDFSLADLEAKF